MYSYVASCGDSCAINVEELDRFRAEWPAMLKPLRVLAANNRDDWIDDEVPDWLTIQFYDSHGPEPMSLHCSSALERWRFTNIHHEFYVFTDPTYRKRHEEFKEKNGHVGFGSDDSEAD